MPIKLLQLRLQLETPVRLLVGRGGNLGGSSYSVATMMGPWGGGVCEVV